MKSSLGDLMRQAQQVQENLKKAQEELTNLEVTGEAGAGLVRIIMTGRHDVKRVEIDPSLIAADKEMLEDLIAAAVNDASRRVEQASKDKLSSLAGAFDLPSELKLPM
ncbi:MAG: YbaB/EbfC family nucleoid-associated protein [Gammaproteobacteria bacterium]|nr:YbaB/EbfC family nucleoid-associated protein [Gammaproteobacteria bacterium]MCI0590459.1 YbaB/EbfC family nucleoid-associated protein [Gammaproteobacteria bacterium]